MTFKLKALVAALATVASVGAQAAVAQATSGNSSVLFVAMDIDNNIGLVVDLGLSMSDFTNSTVLTSAGSTASWNFATNAFTDNTTLAAPTGNSWDVAYLTFKSTQSGGDYQWGVIAADSVAGGTIAGRGMLATGNATPAEMLLASTSTPTGTALTNYANFAVAAANIGTLTSANNGAGATTSTSGAAGAAWLNTSMKNNFNGNLTWNYLLSNGATSTFQWQQQVVANPVVVQFGAPNATDALAVTPGTFSFDTATDTLVWSVATPVPEPGSYALLMAGLAAVGFVVRRRRAA